VHPQRVFPDGTSRSSGVFAADPALIPVEVGSRGDYGRSSLCALHVRFGECVGYKIILQVGDFCLIFGSWFSSVYRAIVPDGLTGFPLNRLY
jgi:hypothetical protein